MNTSKIIKGVVNNGRYTVTASIVKEDYGLYLQIANGQQILRECIGAFLDITHKPTEPEEVSEDA